MNFTMKSIENLVWRVISRTLGVLIVGKEGFRHFSSVQAAVQAGAQKSSAIIFVRDGVYDESVSIDSSMGSGQLYIVGSRKAVINGGTQGHAIWSNRGSFALLGMQLKTTAGAGTGYCGFQSANAPYVWFIGTHFSESDHVAFNQQGFGSQHWVVALCIFDGTIDHSAILIESPGVLIVLNYIKIDATSGSYCIDITNQLTGTNPCVVANYISSPHQYSIYKGVGSQSPLVVANQVNNPVSVSGGTVANNNQF